MLNDFRSLAGSLWAKLLLGVLVLAFSVWGIGDMVRHPGSAQIVATVGDMSITRDEFMRPLRREMENLRNMLGDHYSPDMLKAMHIEQTVLRQLVQQDLLKLESQSLGLIPSDADVVRRIRSNPSFQDNKGNFDKNIFEAMLKNSGMSEKTYVDNLRRDMAVDLVTDTLLLKTPVHEEAVKVLAESREEQRNLTLYTLGSSLVAVTAQPDDAQLSAYYKAHAADFTAPEYRSLSYVTFEAKDVSQNATVSEADLRAAYKERLDDFKKPERRVVEQLLYSSEEKARKAAEMLKSGKSLDDVAKQTDIMNKGAVALGEVERSNVLESAADAVFSLPEGGYTDPVKSPFGWHIFHVSKINPPGTISFDEARPALEKDLKQRSGDDALNAMTNKLEDALAGGSTLKEAADAMKLKMVEVGLVNHQGLSPDGARPKNLPDYDKFLDTAFKTEEKSESGLITSKGGIYYIVHVDSVTPERLHPLDEVKPQVIAGWQKETRANQLGELAQVISTEMADAKTRPAAIAKYNLQPSSNVTVKRSTRSTGDMALPAGLVADAFSHGVQEGTHPYATKNGDFMLGVVNSIIPLPSGDPKLKTAMAEVRKELTSTVQNEIADEYALYLSGKYAVNVHENVLKSLSPASR